MKLVIVVDLLAEVVCAKVILESYSSQAYRCRRNLGKRKVEYLRAKVKKERRSDFLEKPT